MHEVSAFRSDAALAELHRSMAIFIEPLPTENYPTISLKAREVDGLNIA